MQAVFVSGAVHVFVFLCSPWGVHLRVEDEGQGSDQSFWSGKSSQCGGAGKPAWPAGGNSTGFKNKSACMKAYEKMKERKLLLPLHTVYGCLLYSSPCQTSSHTTD